MPVEGEAKPVGVSFMKRDCRWQAKLSDLEWKIVMIGYFPTKAAATAAYDLFILSHWGDWPREWMLVNHPERYMLHGHGDISQFQAVKGKRRRHLKYCKGWEAEAERQSKAIEERKEEVVRRKRRKVALEEAIAAGVAGAAPHES